jgi:hypothetical protein
MFPRIWRKSWSDTRNIRDAGNPAGEDDKERRSSVRSRGRSGDRHPLMRRRGNCTRQSLRSKTAHCGFYGLRDL